MHCHQLLHKAIAVAIASARVVVVPVPAIAIAIAIANAVTILLLFECIWYAFVQFFFYSFGMFFSFYHEIEIHFSLPRFFFYFLLMESTGKQQPTVIKNPIRGLQ